MNTLVILLGAILVAAFLVKAFNNLLIGVQTQIVGRLSPLLENYPQHKSNENVKMIQEELTTTENKISFARQFYNDIATKFNISQQTFPPNLIAGMFGFQAAELFEGSAGSEA